MDSEDISMVTVWLIAVKKTSPLFTGSDDSRVGLLATPFPWITMVMLGLGKAGNWREVTPGLVWVKKITASGNISHYCGIWHVNIPLILPWSGLSNHIMQYSYLSGHQNESRLCFLGLLISIFEWKMKHSIHSWCFNSNMPGCRYICFCCRFQY